MHRAIPLIVYGLLLWPAGAQADERRRFAVDYRGPASCPTKDEMAGYLDDWAFVRRRLGRREADWRRLVVGTSARSSGRTPSSACFTIGQDSRA